MNNYFIDMDGTLTVYDRWVYETDGHTPWYQNIQNTHYFRTLPPQDKMLKLTKDLLTSHPEQVYILTSVGILEEAPYYEVIMDKIGWVREYLPALLPDHFLVVRSRIPVPNKMTKSILAAKTLNRPIGKQDILYDDFNLNLEEWESAGGTVIKVLNGLNHYRDDMECLVVSNSNPIL